MLCYVYYNYEFRNTRYFQKVNREMPLKLASNRFHKNVFSPSFLENFRKEKKL